MKKNYVNPEMDVIKMETMSVLAESLEQSTQEASNDGENYTKSLAGEFFGGGDDGEDW